MVTPTQLKMGFEGIEEVQQEEKPELSNGRANKLNPNDRAFHDWYRFVLSFPQRNKKTAGSSPAVFV
jgi:hypothetical protein